MVVFRSLERRRIKGQLFKDTLKRKVSKRLLEKKSQKKKIMRNEEGTNHQCCWHNIDSGTQESKWRESMVSWKPQDDTIKGEAANSERHSATVNQSKIIEKTLLGFKKREKRQGNTARYPQTATRERTWIQMDSNFTSLRGLKSHQSL